MDSDSQCLPVGLPLHFQVSLSDGGICVLFRQEGHWRFIFVPRSKGCSRALWAWSRSSTWKEHSFPLETWFSFPPCSKQKPGGWPRAPRWKNKLWTEVPLTSLLTFPDHKWGRADGQEWVDLWQDNRKRHGKQEVWLLVKLSSSSPWPTPQPCPLDVIQQIETTDASESKKVEFKSLFHYLSVLYIRTNNSTPLIQSFHLTFNTVARVRNQRNNSKENNAIVDNQNNLPRRWMKYSY